MLLPNQVEMGGFLMGGPGLVKVRSLVPGPAGGITQDTPNPVRGGTRFGRDTSEGRALELELRVHGRTGEEALAALGAVAAAWDDEALRVTPGKDVVLRYERAGRTRVVFGRPRSLVYDPDLTVKLGRVPATARFDTSDALFYGDTVQSVSVGLVAGISGAHPLPAPLPFTFAPGGPRSGVIPAVGGDAPAPVVVKFEGPVVGPAAMIGGRLVAFPALSLAFDQSVTVDTRKMTVTRNDGASLAGALSRLTFLPDVRLRPGASEIVYSGSDLTGTSRCTVSWRPAYHGF